MPEGHTAHRSARDLRPLVGRPVAVSSPQGRFPESALVDAEVLDAADAYGKHLLLAFAIGQFVHVHLGMKGVWLRRPTDARPMPQARLRLALADLAWELVAPSRCELLGRERASALVAGLGPDPLRPDADRAAAVAALGSTARAVGAALLDQAVVAGVGNVFRAEALHVVGVHPATPGRHLDRAVLERLWDVLVAMMSRAVDDGRIVTVDAPDRSAVPQDGARRVYKRDRCYDCGATVVVAKVGGRTSYHCPVEQPAGWVDGSRQGR
jgi:endonuclease-8